MARPSGLAPRLRHGQSEEPLSGCGRECQPVPRSIHCGPDSRRQIRRGLQIPAGQFRRVGNRHQTVHIFDRNLRLHRLKRIRNRRIEGLVLKIPPVPPAAEIARSAQPRKRIRLRWRRAPQMQKRASGGKVLHLAPHASKIRQSGGQNDGGFHRSHFLQSIHFVDHRNSGMSSTCGLRGVARCSRFLPAGDSSGQAFAGNITPPSCK